MGIRVISPTTRHYDEEVLVNGLRMNIDQFNQNRIASLVAKAKEMKAVEIALDTQEEEVRMYNPDGKQIWSGRLTHDDMVWGDQVASAR
jgi:hypothetical protein